MLSYEAVSHNDRTVVRRFSSRVWAACFAKERPIMAML